jgi:hypothetical protein
VVTCPPALEPVERLVPQLDLAAAEAPEQVFRSAVLAVSCPEPFQGGQWLVHGDQGLGQRGELRPDPAAAVVQELSNPVGEGAAAAEPAAVQFVLIAAARAGEGLREPGAVGADRGPVDGTPTGKGPVLAAAWAGSPGLHGPA